MDGYLRLATTATVPFGPFISTAGAYVDSLTIQKADVRLKKNGGNMAAANANQGVADAGAPHDELGVYDGTLDPTDTDTPGRLDIYVSEAGAIVKKHSYMVMASEVYDKFFTTAGAITVGLSTQGKADVNAEVVDALATDTYAEPGQTTPPSTDSLSNKISMIYKATTNKWTQDASQFSLYDGAGSTVDQKATVSDDGSTTTRGNLTTGA